MAATSIVPQLNPAWRGRRPHCMGSVEPKPTGLENRQWPSRSFVGSNPTPAAHRPDSAWLSRCGGFQNQLKSCCLVRLRTGLGNRLPPQAGVARFERSPLR